jgi:hypothetical protein
MALFLFFCTVRLASLGLRHFYNVAIEQRLWRPRRTSSETKTPSGPSAAAKKPRRRNTLSLVKRTTMKGAWLASPKYLIPIFTLALILVLLPYVSKRALDKEKKNLYLNGGLICVVFVFFADHTGRADAKHHRKLVH